MKVKFVPIDKEFEITPDKTVRDLCNEQGIFVKSVCNGLPSCAECRVKIVEGEHNVLPPNQKELGLIGTGYFVDRRRLSCQIRCFGDVTIDISEQIEKEKESHGPKRPQGAIKKDVSEESHAVVGSILEQEGQLSKEEAEREANRRRSRSGHRSKDERGSRLESSNQEGSEQNKKEASEGDRSNRGPRKEGKGEGGRNRNRNRNRNRKRSGKKGGSSRPENQGNN